MRTRRQFISDCSAAMTVLAVAPLGSFAGPATFTRNFRPLETLSYADLAAQVNTSFHVCISPGKLVELTLIKIPLARPTPVRPGKPLPGDAGHEKFSLIFSGSKETVLAPAIHPFQHAQLGRFEMHIGQIGTTDGETVRYEAGFNRPAPAAFAAST
jgi:hypothetical protein